VQLAISLNLFSTDELSTDDTICRM